VLSFVNVFLAVSRNWKWT